MTEYAYLLHRFTADCAPQPGAVLPIVGRDTTGEVVAVRWPSAYSGHWWVGKAWRLATPEEIAQARLASLGAEDAL